MGFPTQMALVSVNGASQIKRRKAVRIQLPELGTCVDYRSITQEFNLQPSWSRSNILMYPKVYLLQDGYSWIVGQVPCQRSLWLSPPQVIRDYEFRVKLLSSVHDVQL